MLKNEGDSMFETIDKKTPNCGGTELSYQIKWLKSETLNDQGPE